ncbi:nicotinamide riboside transporter PnuC [Paenibacillus sacheonensis]|uniref:Nicotinamide riboside transporter PnuC n=1 Tax=Paenibacillus sacheonensis TaxID=742054 RepID=A0A7X5BZ96_9BACL|nr:nicotinamide riboside transporter PnuC [Paenibacillus sacheonensis]MBM7563450.1 nicotinamide mononucleotide transporter [Paenibacillus sacheonensis]NBC67995.1 nicotinamide riboside transporter PnuC [Paenibacillus sacheonensis]
MNKPWVLPALFAIMVGIAYYTSSSALEIAATTTGLLSVWLTARERIWAWPIGLVNVACFFYMFEDAKLYADMMLQVFFFVLSVYGWIAWLNGRGAAKVRPTRTITVRLSWTLALLLVAVTLLWGYVLEQYTGASIPYADALIATLSLIAQYLLSSKILQNWLCWIAVDVMSIVMYAYKDLHSLAFLYTIFLAIAIAGHLSWQREYRSLKGGVPV